MPVLEILASLWKFPGQVVNDKIGEIRKQAIDARMQYKNIKQLAEAVDTLWQFILTKGVGMNL